MRSGIVHQAVFPALGKSRGICFFFLFITIGFLSLSKPAFGVELTLQWDASEGAHGYVLHYGARSQSYDMLIDVGPNLQHTVSGLEEGASYYFAVTAYNEHAESCYSAEISHAPQPNQPPTAHAGSDMSVQENTTVHLNGSDSFDPDDGIQMLYWEQLSGPAVILVGQEEDICQFVTPDIGSTPEKLVFQVVVQDYAGQISSATCTVTVNACPDTPTETSNPDTATETSSPESPTVTATPDNATETSDPESPTVTANPDTATGTPDPESPTVTANPDTATEASDPETLSPPEEFDENTTPADAIEIQKAIYRTRRDKLIVKARISGANNAPDLTAWAISEGKEIKLGKLRYLARRGYYRKAFRDLGQAPDSIVIVSNTGAEASSVCIVRR